MQTNFAPLDFSKEIKELYKQRVIQTKECKCANKEDTHVNILVYRSNNLSWNLCNFNYFIKYG